jgi:hypothetical protein
LLPIDEAADIVFATFIIILGFTTTVYIVYDDNDDDYDDDDYKSRLTVFRSERGRRFDLCGVESDGTSPNSVTLITFDRSLPLPLLLLLPPIPDKMFVRVISAAFTPAEEDEDEDEEDEDC